MNKDSRSEDVSGTGVGVGVGGMDVGVGGMDVGVGVGIGKASPFNIRGEVIWGFCCEAKNRKTELVVSVRIISKYTTRYFI